MGINARFCITHSERTAIGVCVMTRQPMCEECSTRYEGVNYSKEGLRLLQEQRLAAKGGRAGRRRFSKTSIVAWALSPALMYLMYLAFSVSATTLINMLH